MAYQQSFPINFFQRKTEIEVFWRTVRRVEERHLNLSSCGETSPELRFIIRPINGTASWYTLSIGQDFFSLIGYIDAERSCLRILCHSLTLSSGQSTVTIVISSIMWQINALSFANVNDALLFARKLVTGWIGWKLRCRAKILREREITVLVAKCPISTDHRNPMGVVACDGRTKKIVVIGELQKRAHG